MVDPILLPTLVEKKFVRVDTWWSKKKNFMAPFYGWGSTASRLQPLRGGSLNLKEKYPLLSKMSLAL